MFWYCDHTTAPSHRRIHGNRLDHAQRHVSHQITVDLLLPVPRDRDRRVDGGGLHVLPHGDGHGLALHQGQLLTGALIECAAGVVIQNPLPQLRHGQ